MLFIMSHQSSTNIQENRNSSNKFSDQTIIPSNLRTWWDSSNEAEHTGDIYQHQEGCLDYYFLDNLFKQIDQNIFRLVRNRMKPYYKKAITGTSRMSVGHLTLKQFYCYLERLESSVRCSKIRESKFTLPACNSDNRVYASLLTCEWKNGAVI